MTQTSSFPPELSNFVNWYSDLNEAQKRQVGRHFQTLTGGKLSQWNSPTPVAVGIIPILMPDGSYRILGVQRGIEPRKGQVALPGGFVNRMETPCQGASREVFEEVGVSFDQPWIYDSEFLTAINENVFFYRAPRALTYDEFLALSQSIPDPLEVQSLVLIDPSLDLAFPSHQAAARSALVHLSEGTFFPLVVPSVLSKIKP